jgi:hypothetical protein
MAHPSQLAGFAVPHCSDVLGKKRYDEIFAVAADRNLSPKGNSVLSEGLDDIKSRHTPPRTTRAKSIGSIRDVERLIGYPQSVVAERD